MKMSESAVVRWCDAFTHIVCEGSMEECLDQLSTVAAHVLNAQGCTILLLSEEEAAEAGLCGGAELGMLPERHGKARKATGGPRGVVGKSHTPMVRGSHGNTESMYSTIVLHGKIIGVIHACRPQQQGCFGKDDLDLFSILTPLITKSIQVIQLQNLLKSRFTQIALTKSNEVTLGDLISGVMQNPNQIARILAKSFYREMLNAGFTFNQIIFAATEVISELSLSLRKHSANHKHRAKQGGAPLERLLQRVEEPSADLSQAPAQNVTNSIAA